MGPLAQHSDDNKKCSQDSEKIATFYVGKNVLVTGGSGFLGKVLLWKLYESCRGINKIYVLLRPKNGISAHKRLIQMLKAAPFNMKHDYNDLLNKMIAIESDITSEGLGLSQADRSLLIEQVNIVFHSAASVSFDAPLKDNLRDNVLGTQQVLRLCNEIVHLDALVHVSTAYSNCHRQRIPEATVPLQRDVDEAIKFISSKPADDLESMGSNLLEGRPNTYTYTKALAEHCVIKNEGKYPISIVRPSIVVSSAREPCPGWVDNFNGLSGPTCLFSVGLMRAIFWDYHAKSDLVPVDYVANFMICTAYDVNARSPSKVRIYNMTSGNINPIKWGPMIEKMRLNASRTPPSEMRRPMIHPPRHWLTNAITISMTKIFSELPFALVADFIIMLKGHKQPVLKMTKKMHHGYKILLPFTTKTWDFEVNNVLDLSNSLKGSDAEIFDFDLRTASWDELIASIWTGARKFLLKDKPTMESFMLCLKRQKRVTILHNLGLSLVLAAIAMLSYFCLS